MPPIRHAPLLQLLLIAVLLLPVASAATSLPVFFFHGVFGNVQSGHNVAANLTAEGHTFVPLSFCTSECSTQILNNQVQLAITQIRSIVKSDARYNNGYVFMAHSQGGAIARAVIQEMDDHKVKTFISMAAVANGIFHGPQREDASGVSTFVNGFAATLFPPKMFSTSKYTKQDLNGKFQYDIDIFARDHQDAQQYSHFNLARSPVKVPWTSTNKFLAVYNNLNPCTGDAKCANDQKRRRNNYLKLEAAHYFASSADGTLTPWQTSILGQYNELASVEEIKTKGGSMHVIDMKDTTEYKQDTYGLKSLNARGCLSRHIVAKVPHICWTDNSGACRFVDVYDKHVYPILKAAILGKSSCRK